MTHLTLDILLISDPSSGTDKTGEWESQCDDRNSPKIKFPLKLRDERMDILNVDFSDPVIEEPKIKKKEKNKNEVKVVTLTSRKNKDKDKNKLF